MGTMTARARASLLAALTLALAGCGSQGPMPQESFYRIEPAPPAAPAAARLPGLVEVGRPQADGIVAERALVYAEPDGTLHKYHYDAWAEPPARMLQEAVVTALRASKAVEQVVTPEMRLKPDYTVDGRLQRLELRLGSGGEAVAVVGLELAVVAERDGKVLTIDTYHAERRAAEASVPAAVTAMDAALTEILARFTQDIARAASRRP